MSAAEQTRLAYLGSNQAECVPWDELKPEMRERWELVVRTVKQDAHYDDAATAEYVQELRAQLDAVMAERDAARCAEKCRTKQRDKAESELAALHPGETVEGVLMERDSLLIQLDYAQQELAALRQPVDATPTDAQQDRESLVRALIEAKRQRDELASKLISKNPNKPVYGGWHFENGYKIVPNVELSSNPGELPTPTDAQVEALARVLCDACAEGFEESHTTYLRRLSRAAYAHIGRVPVGFELDVTADEAEAAYYNPTVPVSTRYSQFLIDLCRSRIKPVYECKECAKMQTEMKARLDNLAAATYAIRAALEGE